MLYERLPVIFLSAIASGEGDSTNCHIASYILAHLEEVGQMGIAQLARHCSVSNSSISRFCRAVGLEDFMELKELIGEARLHPPDPVQGGTVGRRAGELAASIGASLELVRDSLVPELVAMLCRDIHSYPRVAAFGLLKGAGAAISLQTDLLMLGKVASTKISLQQQMEYLEQVGKEDLVILFSYTGAYFDYRTQRLPESLKKARVYFITGGEGVRPDAYRDVVISFRSLLDYTSHPYQLQFAASIIAQEYAAYVRGEG